jgi:hypothetical protein
MHDEAVGRSGRYYRNPKRYELREKEVLLIRREEARNWGLPDTDNYYLSYGNFMFKREKLEGEMAVHGGISLWEMCIPLAIFTPRK